jgi:hypothetical protein
VASSTTLNENSYQSKITVKLPEMNTKAIDARNNFGQKEIKYLID